jgi:putative glutathione S-transferase
LWDKQQNTIVSNESAEIIRMFNSAFDQIGATPGDFYPSDKCQEIDEINELIYHNINNGVYRAGFATTQAAYDDAVTNVFNLLDQLEQRLTSQCYLVGEQITEADWRLFTTLIRFDAVYVGHFKCNIKRIVDYPRYIITCAIYINSRALLRPLISITSKRITTAPTTALIQHALFQSDQH